VADEKYDPTLWDDQWGPIDDPISQYVDRWGVEGWNDAGGAVSLGGPWGLTLEGAIARAEEFSLRGDYDGKMYDHVAVVRFTYRTCVKTHHHSLDEAREML